MVMLDADTAGCVCTWLNNGGALDPERRHILQTRLENLARIVPQISAPSGRRYYQRLHQLALLILSAPNTK
ncbi:hypothetical protein L7D48_22450 [Streptomyces sp. S1A]|uniref:hypothetical protein n=1 Tax=Streptomyces sp. ICN903 TaxID=2964654 RepID=UPI001EDA0592|nr:hypothetical protein [Streptomyces sp. ICN903]MCG3043296.1 hypothetical protein [Streptomyces sp. ICN903]